MKLVEKRISIVVPVYNCEKYIERLFNCINNQNYNNYELIIINDGSTDKSLDIINFCSNENTIVIDKANTGVSDSRNIGLNRASGEYVTFLDADDFCDDNYLKNINYYLNNYSDIELLCFGFFSEVESNNFISLSSDKFFYKEKYYRSRNDLSNDLVSLWDNKMLYNIWNKVYRLDIIRNNNIEFYSSNWGEDVDFNRKYMSIINNVYVSDKCFYHYVRERVGAATGKFRDNFFEIRKNEFDEFNLYFQNNNIKFYDYIEFSSRRFIECVLGVIENLFCSDLPYRIIYSRIYTIIHDESVKLALKYAKPKSFKTFILLLPLKLKSSSLTFFMGRVLNIIKNKIPGVFNHLKNTR